MREDRAGRSDVDRGARQDGQPRVAAPQVHADGDGERRERGRYGGAGDRQVAQIAPPVTDGPVRDRGRRYGGGDQAMSRTSKDRRGRGRVTAGGRRPVGANDRTTSQDVPCTYLLDTP
ncbi:hypothetical protein K1Y78_29610 [Streptomyces sp. tea 10]|nr:hypothetical protein [Streptomyces sp. tea 10]